MSRVSKGKIKRLWTLYGVDDIVSRRRLVDVFAQFTATAKLWEARLNDPRVTARISQFRDAIDKRLAEPTVQQIAAKGYYDGVRKLNSEFDFETIINVTHLENPMHLTLLRGKHKPAKDINSDYYYVPCGGIHLQSGISGKTYTRGSFERLAYPDMVDEEKPDRLLGMIAEKSDAPSST